MLVTGGEGFVGARVVARLRRHGHDVALTSLASGGPGVITVDLRERGALHGRLRGVDVVIHLAARSGGVGFQRSPDESVFADNRAMTDGVLAAAVADEVPRVVMASSTVVYRPRVDQRHSESDPTLGPSDSPSPYAWSKICDEVAARWVSQGSSCSVVVGRFANVYGPGGPSADSTGTVIHTLLRRALEASAAGSDAFEARGDPAAVRSFIYVDDVASAVELLALDHRAEGIYNLDSGVGIPIAGAAASIALAVEPRLRAVFSDPHPTDIPYRVSDPSRMAALGFRAETSLEAGLAECVVAALGPAKARG